MTLINKKRKEKNGCIIEGISQEKFRYSLNFIKQIEYVNYVRSNEVKRANNLACKENVVITRRGDVLCASRKGAALSA